MSDEKNSTRQGPHPFQRLQANLAALIGKTPPGERLPAEPELARQLGVSRATLREAMRSFEGQGLIRRRQGVGTFVVSQSQVIESGLEVLQSVETLADSIGLDVSMGDLRVASVNASEEQAARLGVPPGTPLSWVRRVILADGRPVCFLEDLLPEEVLGPGDLRAGFTGSVLDLLLRKGTPELADSWTEIQAVAAPAEVARALEIQRGDVLLHFTAALKDLDGRVVDFSHSYFLPGYFRFHVVRRVGERPSAA